jgi:hypothetical protein
MPVTSYSTTAANNNGAPPNGCPEGWSPSSVNDWGRQLMADIAVEAQKNAVKVLASVAGTDTVTGSMTPDLTAYSAGMIVILTPANNNTGAATLNIDSLGALDIQKYDGEALAAGDLRSGIPAVLVLDSGADDFILLNPQSQITTSPNTSASEFGYKGIPQNAQSGDYTLVLTDAAKHLYDTGTGARTYTIPANASVAFPVGTAVTFVNFGTGDRTIAITSDTMNLAGVGTTGSRTLAVFGVATALKVTSTVWVINGTGLS